MTTSEKKQTPEAKIVALAVAIGELQGSVKGALRTIQVEVAAMQNNTQKLLEAFEAERRLSDDLAHVLSRMPIKEPEVQRVLALYQEARA